MSTKERDRLKVLHEVQQSHLTQRVAAGQLGVMDRWVPELLVRIQQKGTVSAVLTAGSSHARYASGNRTSSIWMRHVVTVAP